MYDNKIQWFPGHMAKAKRKIESSLKLIDVVVEILDARVPISSRSPLLYDLTSSKPKMILLNKCDLADPIFTPRWVEFLKQNTDRVLPVDCKSGRGIEKFSQEIKSLFKNNSKKIRIMTVGIPNVGKSSFINRMMKLKTAKVENRPGVTRGNQWFSLKNGLEILDTPGVLSHKFETEEIAQNLAFTGSIKDKVLDIEELSYLLLCKIINLYPELIEKRFGFKISELNPENLIEEIFNIIARKRGMIVSGGAIDTDRTANRLLEEFRNGKIGRMTLERP
jgi:ribosome biogenesis GTPase A